MNCPNCGISLPDSARFCYSCGAALGGGGAAPPARPTPPAATAAPPPLAPAGTQSLKCPSCGAPIHPVFGDMVVSCDYCGGSVTLGAQGWKEINKHTMLTPKVVNSAQALEVVQRFLDQGFFHKKAFEESTIQDQKLSFVPFWIVPVTATTNYVYTDVAVGVGSTVATIAVAEVLGGALGGRRGGFTPIPIPVGPTVNPSRQDTISGTYEFPVVAVKAMSAYQPKDYRFALDDRTFFDKKSIPAGTPVLNGDLGEDAAAHAARSFVTQLQTEAAHKRHSMVSQLNCDCQVTEAELLHVPIYYYLLDRKGQKSTVLVDAHAAQVIQTVGP